MNAAWRSLRRRPGTLWLAVATLALGVGAATATFSALHAVLLRPLPFADAERLVWVWATHERHKTGHVEVAYGNFATWAERNQVFEALAITPSVNIDASLTGPGRAAAENGQAAWVSDRWFALLGVEPALGRFFTAGEETPGNPPTVVISHGLWQRRYGGDPSVIGQTLNIDGDAATIIGVAPRDYDFPREIDLWALLPRDPQMVADQAFRVWKVVGRLRPGVTVSDAEREMNDLALEMAGTHPNLKGFGIQLQPVLDDLFGTARRALPLLQGAVLLVVLIACMNVGHLLLTRAVARRRELALRLALGADGQRLARGMLAESAVVAALGGLGGVLIASLGIAIIRALAPPDLPRLAELGLDGPTLLFLLGVVLATGLLTGLLPAWHALRTPVGEGLREGDTRSGSGRSGARLRAALVVSEIAVATTLLVGALLLVASFRNLTAVDPGWRAEGLFSARVALVRARYPDGKAQAAFFDKLLQELERTPGVESAAAVLLRPLGGAVGWDYPFTIQGQTEDEQTANPYSNFEAVSPRYFDTVGLSLVKGRDFSAADTLDAPRVAVVNESFAARYWPGQDPIGQQLKIGKPAGKQPWATVIGVVRDGRYRGWDHTRLDLYMPTAQMAQYRSDFVVRSRHDAATMERLFRAAVTRLDPAQAVSSVTTMDALVDRELARPRFNLSLLSGFAGLAAFLAALGILSVMLHAVEQRTREIGVRRALGASPRAVLQLVVGDSARLTGAGLLLGAVAAALLGGLMQALLFGVPAHAPVAYLGGALAVCLVALLAVVWPAQRALAVQPSVALRQE